MCDTRSRPHTNDLGGQGVRSFTSLFYISLKPRFALAHKMLATIYTAHLCGPKQGWGIICPGAENVRDFLTALSGIHKNSICYCMGAENTRDFFFVASMFVEVGTRPFSDLNVL